MSDIIGATVTGNSKPFNSENFGELQSPDKVSAMAESAEWREVPSIGADNLFPVYDDLRKIKLGAAAVLINNGGTSENADRILASVYRIEKLLDSEIG